MSCIVVLPVNMFFCHLFNKLTYLHIASHAKQQKITKMLLVRSALPKCHCAVK